ncbi:hypothetical protein NPJ88_016280 [Halomonas elongata]|uniref:hypothetical protein n=1 Tax=Halomonas elongata TaxID=2746 RepID=UPI00255B3D5A|nr:hypothetical protein [Halomonas elongata]MDL4863891.1 hypothetical protein [Halomonas elongata]
MNWKSIVKTVAPALGTALAGPMAGTAIRELGNRWLGDENATAKDVEQAVQNASPDQLAQLREIDADFEARMRELDIDLHELEVEDRKSARAMFSVNIWPQIILSAVFGLGYFVVLYLLMSNNVAIGDGLRDTFSIVLGVMTGAVKDILQFWFGSSMGSKEKTHQLSTGTSR